MRITIPIMSAARSLIGFSSDFYWVDGQSVRTNYSLAVEQACSTGWNGWRCNMWRIQAPTSDEYGHAWFESAISNICDALGSSGTLVCVVGDQTYLNDWGDSGQTIYDTMDSIFVGHAASTGKPRVLAQIGNEPYIDATGTHAELDAGYAANALTAAAQVKADHPSCLLCMPPLGTFQTGALATAESTLDTNWAQMVSLFAGHGIFDYCAANLYQLTGSGSDALIVYGANALRANAATLGCNPIITEIGLHSPSASALQTTLKAAGSTPKIVWRVGAGDDFDLIATGAIAVPS